MLVLTPDLTHDYVELLLPDGSFRIRALDLGAGCAVASGTLPQGEADGLPDTWSDPPSGYEWKDRDCGDAWPTYVDASNDGYDDGSGSSTGQPGDYGATQGVASNPEILQWVTQWSGGKARIVITVPTQSGLTGYFWQDGQPASTAYVTDYAYNPGDEVGIYFALATSSDPQNSAFNIKSTINILIGNAPTT